MAYGKPGSPSFIPTNLGLEKKSFYLSSKTLHKWIKVVGTLSLLADGILIALYMALDIPLPGDKSYVFITVFWKMAQRHCRVYKTSKCSSDTYASSSLSSDFMWDVDIVGWENWQSPLISDQVAEMTWFNPGYLLGPQSLMYVISETVYSDPKSLFLLITTGTKEVGKMGKKAH